MGRGRPKKIKEETNEKENSTKEQKEEGKINYEKIPRNKEERKLLIREAVLNVIKKKYMHERFNSRFFMDKTGTKGYIRQEVPYSLPYDKKLFETVLVDLEKEEIIYHIGGPLYKLMNKGQELLEEKK